MKKDEIWQKLKNDHALIYNQPIFTVFLQTTETIKYEHFLELDENQKKLLNNTALLDLIRYSPSTFERSAWWSRAGWKSSQTANADSTNRIEGFAQDSIKHIISLLNFGNLDHFQARALVSTFVYKKFDLNLLEPLKKRIVDMNDYLILDLIKTDPENINLIKFLKEGIRKLNSYSTFELLRLKDYQEMNWGVEDHDNHSFTGNKVIDEVFSAADFSKLDGTEVARLLWAYNEQPYKVSLLIRLIGKQGINKLSIENIKGIARFYTPSQHVIKNAVRMHYDNIKELEKEEWFKT